MLSPKRSTTLLIQAVTLVILLALFTLVGQPITLAQNSLIIEEVGIFETSNAGLSNPAGLIFSPDANAFFVLSTDQPDPATTALALISPSEDWLGAVTLPASLTDPTNLAFDPQASRLILFEAATTSLVEVKAGPGGSLNPNALTRIPAQLFGLQQPQGLVFSPDGRLFILDTDRLIQIQPDPTPGLDSAQALEQGQVSTVDLAPLGLAEARGLAFNPDNGHLYLLSSASQTLVEITQTGQEVSRYDLAEFPLNDPQGLVFAPSRDSTDNPAVSHLFITDTGLPSASGYILELDFTTPTLSALADVEATLVNTTNTSGFNPPSPDPSGLTYISTSNSLLISDAEVEGIPEVYAGVNVFRSSLGGNLQGTLSTMSPNNFSNEPAGIAFNPANGHLFFSNDSDDEIHEIDPGPDNQPLTADDIITHFDTAIFGNTDPEGITFDTQQGHLFMVDGANEQVYQLAPGPNGQFDGVPPAGDDVLVNNFDVGVTSPMNIKDPESVEYDPDNDHLYVMSRLNKRIAETSRNGALIRTIGILAASSDTPAGLAYAPASNGSGAKNLYIVDRGVDLGIDPDNYNDGKMYEMSFPHLGPTPPSSVTLSGPNTGVMNTSYTFTATVNQAATLPLTYVWTATDQTTVTHPNISNRKNTVAFSWAGPGTKTVTVTATNSAGSVQSNTQILIIAPSVSLPLYLPLIMKNAN